MAHAPEIRSKLRAAYVYDRLGLDAAAEKVGIGVATARRWKAAAEAEGDDWDRARAAAGLAGTGLASIAQMIVADYLPLHQAVVEALKGDRDTSPLAKAEALSKLADAFTKTMSAVSKASPQLSRLAVATDVLQRLVAYVREVHPKAAPALLQVLEPFAEDLAREFA
jgi:hypothetical protein